jgi:DNA-binding NarL/FixJ family response regulator
LIRVLVVDDQRVVRDGLAMLVGLMDGIEVVGCASGGKEAIGLATDLLPDVVLMDLRMPNMDGVAATNELRAHVPGASVLVLTTYADDASLFPALQAGARGYLTKDASAEQIEAGIRAVSAGQTWLDPVVQQRLVSAVTQGNAAAATHSQPVEAPLPLRPIPADGLTPREIEVLRLIAGGLSNSEIEHRLVLSNATVKTHVNRIFAKIGARDRAQAVRYAYRHGLEPPGGQG